MERKLGEIFTCNGKLYQVVKGFLCIGCAFINNGNCYLDDIFFLKLFLYDYLYK